MRIGVFGGTFDPIHVGHLIVAQDCLVGLRLDQILFVPAASPPHKERSGMAPAELRLEMVRRAIEGNPAFAISALEIERGGRSFTVDTLRSLRARCAPGDELFFLLGADGLPELATWKEPEALPGLATLVVMERPGHPRPAGGRGLPSGALWQEVTAVGISSTAIRRRRQRGLPITYWVTREVEEFIGAHGLYGA